MNAGFGVDTQRWLIRFGVRSYGFEWTPGIEESGSNYPSMHFDSPYGDKYWKWSWLFFVVFFAKVGS